ncbi:tetratricopeptide repeat protein [Halotia wernerae UHCC 0503]|nr:tetratricopeptide repeat protein [Halotia wernerae UHCC 0503]
MADLTQLLQWLKTFLNSPVGSQQTRVIKTARGQKVGESPPQLTNADLELLFNELLEGVYQGREQQWAIKYLERMEERINVERWIDWLLIFGEKLLTSPAPNHQLARRMVQLGELGVGTIGELSYDIGIQLLTRNLSEWYEDNQEPEAETATSETSDSLTNSPGQELIRNLGELLWESDELEIETTPVSQIAGDKNANEQIGSLILEYETKEVETAAAVTHEQIGSLIGEYQQEEAAATLLPQQNSENLIEEAEATKVQPLLIPAEEDVIGNLSELSLDYVVKTPAPIVSKEKVWDQSLTNLEPQVADTLDELLVRLDQSTNLVQQLASNLAIPTSQTPAINTNLSNAQAWFYQGLQQAKTGDLLGAIASYNQAIEIQPDSHEYWFNRGLTLFHLKHFAEAIASYNQAIELKPDYYKAWHNRGGTLGELGQFEEAIASFEQAIEIQPDYPDAWSSKGLALLKLGQLWEAIASYDEAVRLEPQDPENWYFRGIALAVSEQHQEAIASYDEALELEPDFHEVWIDRGVVLFNLKRWSDAIASWDKALVSQPNFYLAWYNRGVALDNLVRREEAIDSYRQAIAIKPDFHLAWYNQAVALFYLEQFTEAIVSYDNALQIKLDYWEAWIGRGTAVGHLVNSDTLSSLSTSIAATNPALKYGGYEGKLASYEEGLKHVRPDTYPEGWGRLHLAIGNTHYDLGKKHPISRNYWHNAVTEYNQALLTLTSEDFPQLHLEVLQSLIKALLGVGETAQAQELQQHSINLLQQLLSEPTRPEESKKQLALKFTGLWQLAVDVHVDYGDLVEAWEMAEQIKNSCLNWLLFDWNEEIYSPSYESVQQLLNPNTAIIYWHISPVTLHTFIIKDAAPSPILVFTPIQEIGKISLGETATSGDELPLTEAARRLIEFENWLEDWNHTHREYCSQVPSQQSKSNHSWRSQMEARLLQLKNILQISTIEQELEGITQLILIPHRNLHRLPLHALFYPDQADLLSTASNFTITYLPSIQIGLNLKTKNLQQSSNQKLLSIEHPNSTGYATLKFAQIESEIVSQMFSNPQRIQGSKATKNVVETALFNSNNILHFTGYATTNNSDPKKSELALAGEEKLILEEICRGNLASYNLVTLSACETARINKYNINTEYVGLVNGFLYRKVPHVVSTLWTVESSASALVMIEFYRKLQQDKSATTALAEATTWLKELTAGELTKWYEDLLNNLQSEELRVRTYLATYLYRSSKMIPDKKLYDHPYYWAAFTITGKVN